MFYNSVRRVKGFRLWRHHWEAMLLKKAFYSWRKILLIIVQIVSVVILLALEIASLEFDSMYDDPPARTLSLSSYTKSITVLESPPNQDPNSALFILADEYEAAVKIHGSGHEFKSISNQPMSDFFLNVDESKRRLAFDYIGAASIFSLQEMTVWFNPQNVHDMPISLNLLHNALAR